MSTAVDCKRSVEIEIPLDEVEKVKSAVAEKIRGKARIAGFRPGKAPLPIIKTRFASEIRNEVLEKLLSQAFRDRAVKDNFKVVGTPDVSDLTFEDDQPIRFKAAFEVAPEFEISEYRGLPVQYEEPSVTDAEVDERLESMRESKADYVNVDARPIEKGDFVLVNLKSISGLAEQIEQDNIQIEVDAQDSIPEFAENLTGMTPDETKEFNVIYPADYSQEKLAGKTVRFEITPKTIRRKERPALDDEFAKDLGDYQNLDELKAAVRKSIAHEKQFAAQQTAKEALIDRLVEANSFPIPEAYVDRQIETQVGNQLRELAAKGVDPSTIKLDWNKVKESQRDKAMRNVRAALLLDKVAESEGINATRDEVEHEVQAVAKRQRESVPVARAKLEKEGALARIADNIRTEKTIQFLFDQAAKHA